MYYKDIKPAFELSFRLTNEAQRALINHDHFKAKKILTIQTGVLLAIKAINDEENFETYFEKCIQ